MLSDNVLTHVGVMGMKWGVRKRPSGGNKILRPKNEMLVRALRSSIGLTPSNKTTNYKPNNKKEKAIDDILRTTLTVSTGGSTRVNNRKRIADNRVISKGESKVTNYLGMTIEKANALSGFIV